MHWFKWANRSSVYNLNLAELKRNQSPRQGADVFTFTVIRGSAGSSKAGPLPWPDSAAIQKVRRTEVHTKSVTPSPQIHIVVFFVALLFFFLLFFFKEKLPQTEKTLNIFYISTNSHFSCEEKAWKSIYEHKTHEHKPNVPWYIRSYKYYYSDMCWGWEQLLY